ncbi:tRNA (N6-isopentenyl adenosine(37)-C2)-methylthiotransferase MiaB [Bacteroidetes/Chlorobi group bacterium Naka2016]|jgi:tRNA-2-methylthio-N6-dimethylallyladenosine synthase|nr:MAG: tRNA (N6-isopentenyl adenosine(37)-C2)-methylthiotransferase MiaB [Bacteroidetes/Chlorobi group bacterium Naka2016]
MDNKFKIYIETYGCQMNLSDTEIVSRIVKNAGYELTDSLNNANVVLLNTCSVRENAERKIRERLSQIKKHKNGDSPLVVGILGCMAERLRNKILENNSIVDLAVGPDEYRKVPDLIQKAFAGEKGIAVKLSRVETYDDIEPLRKEGISAWISIMRGCDKFCTYCVVPYTRGRERSRKLALIVDEVKKLWDEGFKEVTLLGQNVNSYKCPETNSDFADLLRQCAKAVPNMRIRFITSHPQDMSDKLIETIAEHDNICKYIHLPIQSGSDRILQLMNRNYTYEHFLGRINKIRSLMPDCALSTDIIAGFPTETLEDHQATLRALEEIRFDGAYMFKYSPREHTKAYKMEDDVPEKEKIRRLNEIIDLQNRISKEINQSEHNKIHYVLAEGPSKKDKKQWSGRTDTNKVVIFKPKETTKVGEIVKVRIFDSTSATLFGEIVQ